VFLARHEVNLDACQSIFISKTSVSLMKNGAQQWRLLKCQQRICGNVVVLFVGVLPRTLRFIQENIILLSYQ